MRKTFIKIWRWVSHTETALSMLGWWHWLSAVLVTGLAVLTGWLYKQEPIILFVIGLGVSAFLVVIFERISAWRWRKQESQRKTSERLADAPKDVAETPQPPGKHDVYLLDAIFFAAFRKWDYKPDVWANHLLIAPLETARQEVIQKAVDDDLPVWGRVGFSGPLVKLPADYWSRCEIGFFESWKDDRENVATKPRSGHWGDDSSYRNLKTSKGIVEQLWSAKSVTEDIAEASQGTERKYDTPIHEAIMYVARRTGDNDDQSCFEITRRALRQAGLDNEIKFRGRRELEGTPGDCEDVHSWIEQSYWSDHVLNEVATHPMSESFDHTQASDLKTELHRNRYWTVRVNTDEIKARWS